MSDELKRAKRYRDMAKECCRLSATACSTGVRDDYLRMAEHFSTLAEAEGASTQEHMNGTEN